MSAKQRLSDEKRPILMSSALFKKLSQPDCDPSLHGVVVGGPRPAARPSELHARMAATACGEVLSRRGGVVSSPVVGSGSGKFGIPWVRMQRDTARSFCISSALTCGGDAVGGPYFAQARCAAWNVGKAASLWETCAIRLFAALMSGDDPKKLEPGKLLMPCERMQPAYSARLAPGDEPPVAAPAAAVVVAVPSPATPALGEPPPPQPAASKESAATATTVCERRHRMLFGAFQSRAGKATSISRPPFVRACALTVASCASAIASTMARPSPTPSLGIEVEWRR
jgi:hypothetical protein